MNVRQRALAVLLQVTREGLTLDTALATQIEQNAGAEKISLLKELCFGVMRWWPRLQAVELSLLDKPLAAKHHDVSVLLWLGFYQLEYTRVAEHAAVSETVACTQAIKKRWAKGLVNALLREFQRNRNGILADLSGSSIFESAHPDRLLAGIQAAWPSDWQKVVANNNARAPFSLRVNLKKITRKEYLENLADKGITAHPNELVESAITLDQPCAVSELPGFSEGLVSVQDVAAQLAAGLLMASPGEKVLDACAAPGGKTCHLLETQQNINLLALDNKKNRLAKINENLSRLSLSCQLKTADASELQTWWDGESVDRILIDAPCSGSGVIRRHPDIKWSRQQLDLEQLVDMQQRLLQQLWQVLRPGGVLLYATCSILPEENQNQIAWLTSQQADVEEYPIDAAWGCASRYGRTILPGEANMDGFYYARLRKITLD